MFAREIREHGQPGERIIELELITQLEQLNHRLTPRVRLINLAHQARAAVRLQGTERITLPPRGFTQVAQRPRVFPAREQLPSEHEVARNEREITRGSSVGERASRAQLTGCTEQRRRSHPPEEELRHRG